MKAQSPLTMTYISIALVLLFVSTLAAPGLYAVLESGKKNNARLQAMEIANTINMMKSSPADITYSFSLASDCHVDINNEFVSVVLGSARSVEGQAAVVFSDTHVIPRSVECSDQLISIKKQGSFIIIEEVP